MVLNKFFKGVTMLRNTVLENEIILPSVITDYIRHIVKRLTFVRLKTYSESDTHFVSCLNIGNCVACFISVCVCARVCVCVLECACVCVLSLPL